MRVDVEVPAAYEELVSGSVASRRGQVVSRQDDGHLYSIVSRVPLVSSIALPEPDDPYWSS